MNRSELRLEVSKIFIKWGLGTRQVAIIDIVNLIELEKKEVKDKMAKDKSPKKEVKKKKKPAAKKK